MRARFDAAGRPVQPGYVDTFACQAIVGEPVEMAVVAHRGDHIATAAFDNTFLPFVVIQGLWRLFSRILNSERPREKKERSVTRALALVAHGIIELEIKSTDYTPVAQIARFESPKVTIIGRNLVRTRVDIDGNRFWMLDHAAQRLVHRASSSHW